MDKRQIEIRQLELRGKLNELAAKSDDLTDDEVAEMEAGRKELRQLDARLATMLAAETDKDSEDKSEGRDEESSEEREYRRLLAAADVGIIASAAIERRSDTDGATRELQQHLGLQGNQVPLDLLVEQRAVTPAPTNVPRTQDTIIAPVFSDGLAMFLGAYMPRVGIGDATFPVLTTRPTVGKQAASGSVAETTGAFAAEALPPERLQASFFWRRTDAARLRGMGEALRDALRRGLSEAVDANLSAQIVSDTTQVTASAADTFDAALGRYVYSRVDGRYAMMESDLRIAIGSETLADWGGLYRGANGDRSLVEALREITGGVRVNPHAVAAASDKQDTFIRRGMRRDIAIPVWDGITLIPDEITRANTGEIRLTAVMMAAFKVIRTDGILRVESQHA